MQGQWEKPCATLHCVVRCSGYFEESGSTAGSRPKKKLGNGKEKQNLKVWRYNPDTFEKSISLYLDMALHLLCADFITVGTAPNP